MLAQRCASSLCVRGGGAGGVWLRASLPPSHDPSTLLLTPASVGTVLVTQRHLFARPTYAHSRLVVRKADSVAAGTHLHADAPLVVLLGWGGARHDQLEKYALLYQKYGYNTVSFIGPAYHFRIPDTRYGRNLSPVFTGRRIYDGTDMSTFIERPIVFHVFSMNGVRSLISLYKWMEVEGLQHLHKRVKALIFDSAPAHTQASRDAHAVVLSTPPDTLTQWIPDWARAKILSTLYRLRNLVANSTGVMFPGTRHLLSLYFHLRGLTLPQYQLFLYSTEDRLVRHKYIQSFHEEQVEAGKEVYFRNFGDSAHVCHYKKYPVKYEKEVIDFVRLVEERLTNAQHGDKH